MENDRYYLFNPTADIDPVFKKEEYIALKGGETISDRINISGFSFSRPASSKTGFPAGSYRLRVGFNIDEWHSSQTNNSGWLNFKIE